MASDIVPSHDSQEVSDDSNANQTIFWKTMPFRAAGVSFMTLISIPIVSTLLVQIDNEMGDTDMVITFLAALLCFVIATYFLLLRGSVTVRPCGKFTYPIICAVFCCIFYFPVLFTGIIDGGYGWVIGVTLALFVSLLQWLLLWIAEIYCFLK